MFRAVVSIHLLGTEFYHLSAQILMTSIENVEMHMIGLQAAGLQQHRAGTIIPEEYYLSCSMLLWTQILWTLAVSAHAQNLYLEHLSWSVRFVLSCRASML